VIGVRVLGTPAPQGSKRHVGGGRLVESSKKVAPWREAVVGACQRNDIAEKRIDTPVIVRMTFWLARPASHRKPNGELRANAPLAPARTPDLDKLVRSTLDGLVQAAVLADDARVVTIHARKRYADTNAPGALIWIDTHVPDTDEQEHAA
jgi:Holliday junction resolvase RusA-like endonuclease